jgi:hypothetical protein
MPATELKEHHILLPADTTANRPGTPTAAMVRYNTSDNKLEYYNGTSWNQLETVETDPYWNNVVLYLRGGSTTDLKGNSSVSVTGASTSTSPGKPFTLAESTSWYLIDNSASSHFVAINSPGVASFDPSQNTNLTIEFWLNTTQNRGGYGHFYDIGGQGSQGVMKFAQSGYGMYFYGGSELINWGSSTLSANTWNHFVFEKAGSTNTTWLNGSRIAQNTNSFPAGTSGSILRLGYSSDTAEYVPHYFDELRVTAAARYNGVATIPVQTKSYPTVG